MRSKTIAGVVKFLIYCTFLVPLVVLPTSFIFPFIVPKILLFRSLTTLILGGYALLLLTRNPEYRPKWTPLTIALFAFLVSFTLSTFFGVDSYHSFWDNHERMLGLFTIFHYVAYFFVCSYVFKTWTDWKWALRLFLVAGSVVMVIGCMQIADPNFLLNGGSPRIISTLGNAIYVGGYGLFLLFVSVLLMVKDSNIIWRWVAGIGGLLAGVGLFFSGTRGSMIGLIVGIVFAAFAYIVVLKTSPRARNIIIIVTALGLLGGGVLYGVRDSKFVEDIPALNRLLHTSLSEVTGGSARSIAWKIAIESWKEKPLFGWGPNNFFYAFNKHYNPESLKFGYGETWFDNAHNIIVNTMAVQGTVGIVTYLGIFGIGIWTVFRLFRLGQFDKHVAVITAAFLIAHLVQNVTVFENPTSYLYFMFWLAFINGMAIRSDAIGAVSAQPKNGSSNVVKEAEPEKPVTVVQGVGVLLSAILMIFVLNVQPARANMKALDALIAAGSDPASSLPTVEAALSFNSPHIDDIRNDVSHSLISAISDTNKKISNEVKQQIVQVVESALLSNIQLHPLDIRVHLSLSQLYQTIAVQTNSIQMMNQAELYLEKALEHSPRRQQIVFNLAIVKLQLGKTDDAIKLFNQAIDDYPPIGESYIRLAYAYLAINQPKLAQATIERANANNVVFSEQEQQSVNQIVAAFMQAEAASSTKKIKK